MPAPEGEYDLIEELTDEQKARIREHYRVELVVAYAAAQREVEWQLSGQFHLDPDEISELAKKEGWADGI